MATVTDVPCLAGVWTKVETNLNEGRIAILSAAPARYYYALVPTASAAPTLLSEGTMFYGVIVNNAYLGHDVYIWPVGAAGSVRSTKEA